MKESHSNDNMAATLLITDNRGRVRRQVQEYRITGPDNLLQNVAATRLAIGSHQANELVLDHRSVSRFHLVIEATSEGFVLKDLDSTNGTWIDGLRVKEAYLPIPRATLRLGEVTLQFSLTQQRSDLTLSSQPEFHGVLGRSPAMREVFSTLERVAPTEATVLIEGESGTGKELVAAAVHRASRRADGPFVVLDCAAIPGSLMESELFGHERGAFTGAVTESEGRFREADGGTLFLDEIGELPLEMQPKLLRVLETKQVRPLGSTAVRSVDVRLVAATNRNLAREVNRGTFREDLYFRLAVVQVRLPRLRERVEDIHLLVEHFIHQTMPEDSERASDIISGISVANWKKLEQLPWPGNVRELRNFIERTLVLSGGPIQTQHVPQSHQVDSTKLLSDVDLDQPFSQLKAETIAAFERAYLFGQLARHNNNMSAAARTSGLDRMNFKRLVRKYR